MRFKGYESEGSIPVRYAANTINTIMVPLLLILLYKAQFGGLVWKIPWRSFHRIPNSAFLCDDEAGDVRVNKSRLETRRKIAGRLGNQTGNVLGMLGGCLGSNGKWFLINGEQFSTFFLHLLVMHDGTRSSHAVLFRYRQTIIRNQRKHN